MNLHCLTNIDIRCAEDKVVKGHDWEFHFVPFSEIWQIDIRSKLLGYHQSFAGELYIALLVGLVDIVALDSFAVTCRDRWMMRHLLSQVLKVISDVFISLTKQWIEGFGGCSFANSQSTHDVHCDKGVPAHRVLLLGSQV